MRHLVGRLILPSFPYTVCSSNWYFLMQFIHLHELFLRNQCHHRWLNGTLMGGPTWLWRSKQWKKGYKRLNICQSTILQIKTGKRIVQCWTFETTARNWNKNLCLVPGCGKHRHRSRSQGTVDMGTISSVPDIFLSCEVISRSKY